MTEARRYGVMVRGMSDIIPRNYDQRGFLKFIDQPGDDVKPYTREEFFEDEDKARRIMVDVGRAKVIVPLDIWSRICETINAYAPSIRSTRSGQRRNDGGEHG